MAVTVAMAAATVLSACSQVAVLQPVAGDGVTAVNNATSDVLASEQVDVLTWPVCEFADNT